MSPSQRAEMVRRCVATRPEAPIVPGSDTPSDEQRTAPHADGPPSQLAPPFLGKYELEGMLGQGGMGVVYRARDTVLGRTVALKMIRAGTLAEGEEVERFCREARAVAQFDHRHLVRIFDFGTDDGRHYYTMPLAGGGSLAGQRQRLAGRPRDVVALLEKVARAVHYAHERGILHRDLKPGNVLLDEEGEPLVSDFGLAKFLRGDVELTRPTGVIGTPAYMAPEQVDPRRGRPGPATDVWALGVILYELLAGRRPFVGEEEELRQGISRDDPPSPRALSSGLDRALEAVVLKCLEKAPGRRYASAAELADDLRRWQDGEPVRARPAGWAGRLTRRLRRSAVARWAAGLLTAAAAAALVVGLTPRTPAPAPKAPSEADRALQEIRDQVDHRRGPVTLVGPTGLPRWYRFCTEPNRPPLEPQEGQEVVLISNGLTLMELVPRLGPGRYRLSAEVLHQPGVPSRSGLYAAHQETEAAPGRGRQHCFASLEFIDTIAWDRWAAEWHYRFCQEGVGHKGGFNDDVALKPLPPVDPPPEVPGRPRDPWRKLALEVGPLGVTGELGQGQASLSCAELAGHLDTLAEFQGKGTPALPYLPQGGVGLYVQQGSAHFRNVVLTPVD
jgi:hypothetical protein